MLDRSPKLPVAHQFSLRGLARSTAYYTPREDPGAFPAQTYGATSFGRWPVQDFGA